MITVAIVGPDGAGKTTVSHALRERLPFPTSYIYMGVKSEATKYSLPSSRLALEFKRRLYGGRKDVPEEDRLSPDNLLKMQTKLPLAHLIWDALRVINRFLEAWYRQIVAQASVLRGDVVIFDRHVLFDSALNPGSDFSLTRLHPQLLEFYLFKHLLPKPDLVFFLDAPAEILFARKGETSVEYLAGRRGALLQLGATMEQFWVIDAGGALADTISPIEAIIIKHRKRREAARGGGLARQRTE